MGADLASYVVQHPESVLHLCEFTCSPTSKTPESNQQQNPLFQQKSKMHSTAHKHHLHTKHPFAYPVLLPFPGGTLTEGFALVASVCSQRGLPWWHMWVYLWLRPRWRSPGRQLPSAPSSGLGPPPLPTPWWRYLRENSTKRPSPHTFFPMIKKGWHNPYACISKISTLGFYLGSSVLTEKTLIEEYIK